jgi:hypothetical protein
VPIHTYKAEDVSAFPRSGSHARHILEIRKRIATEEAQEPELEPKERTMTVLKLTAGLGVTEAGIRVFEDTDRKELRASTTGHGTRGLLVGCEEVLKKKRSLSRHTSHLQVLVHLHLSCWTTEMMIQMTCLKVKLSFVFKFHHL